MTDFSRRHFLFGTLLAGVIPRAGFGSVPSLKFLGYQSPNEKMNIAGVGAGGRAAGVLGSLELREHRRARRRGLGARRGRVQALGQGDEVQGLPPDARQGEEHRRGHGDHPRSHAHARRARGDAARQARVRREAADAHAVGGAPAHRRRREVQGRDADGQPGLLARRHARRRRDHLVGRDRRRHRSAFVPRPRELAAGHAGAAGAGEGARHARLGSVARRRGDASLHVGRRGVSQGVPQQSVRLLPAVQLARLLRFRQQPDRRLGHPPARPGESRAAARQPDQRRVPRSSAKARARTRSRAAACRSSGSSPRARTCRRSRSTGPTPAISTRRRA